jgi:hypothetical protein
MRWINSLIVAAAVIATTYACAGPTSPTESGTLNLMIKDIPFTEAKSLLVTFSEVTAHRAEEEGQSTVPFADAATTRTCDLLKLIDAQDVLGVGTLPAGHYTMLRLVVTSAALYFDNVAAGEPCAPTIEAPEGRSASVTIPSGEVKLNRQFEVPADGATTILIDFDGERSVVELGNGDYRMTPVIAIVSVQ